MPDIIDTISKHNAALNDLLNTDEGIQELNKLIELEAKLQMHITEMSTPYLPSQGRLSDENIALSDVAVGFWISREQGKALIDKVKGVVNNYIQKSIGNIAGGGGDDDKTPEKDE